MMRAVLAIALLLLGCATAKDRARAIDDFVATHPALSRDEVDRMRHREARVGDPLAQVRLAWQGATFDLVQTDAKPGAAATTALYSVRLPIGTEPAYLEPVGGRPQVQLVEDGSVVLSFEKDRLARWQVISLGNLQR